jgi:hypothetical protein
MAGNENLETKKAIENARNTGKLKYGEIDSGVKGFFKKVVRKMISPILLPVMHQQNDYNAKIADVVDSLNDANRKITGIDDTSLDSIDKMIDHLETEIVILRKKVEELEAEKNGKQ